MLLAIIVVAGVALRMLDDRRRDSDQAADRRAEQREAERDEAKEDDGDDTAPEPADNRGDDSALDGTSTGSGSSPALDEPLGISISTGTDPNGDPVLLVDRLGPLVLDSAASIPYVTSVLGEPDSTGPNAVDANVCDASWVAWGLEARFYFGHPPSIAASCELGPVAAALMTGERWFIQPLTGGGKVLGVGDPVSAIRPAFPGSSREQLSGILPALAESTEGYLLVEGSYAGEPFPTLYAIGVDGAIASFLYVSGAE